jgi:hypothetical protein
VDQYAWLADTDNQQIVYELAQHTVSTLRPDEIPILKGLFPRYITLAQQGPIVADSRRHAFGFGDPSGFISEFILAVSISLITELSIKYGKTVFSALTHSSSESISTIAAFNIVAILQDILKEANLTAEQKQQIMDSFMAALQAMLQRK